MRVGLMTTWGDHCGIATYSEQLSVALAKAGAEVFILAADPLKPRDGEALPEVAGEVCWQRTNPTALLERLEAFELDLLHIQHEHGLFLEVVDERRLRPDSEGLWDVMRAARRLGIPVVVTLHTVTAYTRDGRAGFYDKMRQLADAIICHTLGGQTELCCAKGACSIQARVYQVPHGTDLESGLDHLGDRGRGREMLGVDGGQLVVLVPGFVSRPKNIECTIRSWALAYPDIDNRWRAVLVVRGMPPGRDTYHLELEEAVAYLDRPVQLQWAYTSPDDLPHVLAAADIAVLNTTSFNRSASGQAHLCAAASLPLIVPQRPIYAEAINAGAVSFWLDPMRVGDANPGLATAIVALARDLHLRKAVSQSMWNWACRTVWREVAQQHIAIYQEVLS